MFNQRINWVLGLALVFVLILTTNLIDRHHFQQVTESIATIYEDRLVAKGLVYDMNTLMTEKRLALATDDRGYFTGDHRDHAAQLDRLIETFSDTRLTTQEEAIFERLQDDLATLQRLEESVAREPEALVGSAALAEQLRSAQDAVVDDLYALSRIQLDEGQRQRVIAANAMGSIDLLTQIEVFFLVGIAIAVLILILYSPTGSGGTSSRSEQDANRAVS